MTHEGRLRDSEIKTRVARSLQQTGDSAREDLQLSIEATVHLLKTTTALLEKMYVHFAPFGLTYAKFNLLMVLWTSEEGAMPMTELGERMRVTGANITKLADGLEAEGFVVRERKTGDRRMVFAVLTPKGKTMLQEILPNYYRLVDEMNREMTEEEKLDLISLTSKLRLSIGRMSPLK